MRFSESARVVLAFPQTNQTQPSPRGVVYYRPPEITSAHTGEASLGLQALPIPCQNSICFAGGRYASSPSEPILPPSPTTSCPESMSMHPWASRTLTVYSHGNAALTNPAVFRAAAAPSSPHCAFVPGAEPFLWRLDESLLGLETTH